MLVCATRAGPSQACREQCQRAWPALWGEASPSCRWECQGEWSTESSNALRQKGASIKCGLALCSLAGERACASSDAASGNLRSVQFLGRGGRGTPQARAPPNPGAGPSGLAAVPDASSMTSEAEAKAAQQLTRGGRFKELFRRYGKIALGVHLAVYASFFAGEQGSQGHAVVGSPGLHARRRGGVQGLRVERWPPPCPPAAYRPACVQAAMWQWSLR